MSVAAMDSSFDEDDLIKRALHLQGLSGVNYTPPTIQIPAPQGLSPSSSIGPAAKKENAPQHRPILDEPSVMHKLIDTHMETQRLAGKCTTVFEAQSKANEAEIDDLSAERMESLKKEANSAKSRDTWAILANVSQYVVGVTAVVIGTACGGWPGSLLIASGVIGVGYGIANDTNLLKAAVAWYAKSEEQQRNITQFIEMTAFTLQLGLGLAGGFGVGYAGTLAAGNAAPAVHALKNTLPVFVGGFQLGKKYHEKQISDLQARQSIINTEITVTKQNMSTDASKLSNLLQTLDSEAQEVQKAIRAAQIEQD